MLRSPRIARVAEPLPPRQKVIERLVWPASHYRRIELDCPDAIRWEVERMRHAVWATLDEMRYRPIEGAAVVTDSHYVNWGPKVLIDDPTHVVIMVGCLADPKLPEAYRL